MLDLAPAAQQLRTIVDGISEHQLLAATPCATYLVSGLVNHVLGLTMALRYAADTDPRGSADPPGPDVPAEAELPPDWRERVGQHCDELVSPLRAQTFRGLSCQPRERAETGRNRQKPARPRPARRRARVARLWSVAGRPDTGGWAGKL